MAFVKRVTVPSTVVIGDTRVALLDVDNVGVKVEFSPDHFEQTGYTKSLSCGKFTSVLGKPILLASANTAATRRNSLGELLSLTVVSVDLPPPCSTRTRFQPVDMGAGSAIALCNAPRCSSSLARFLST